MVTVSICPQQAAEETEIILTRKSRLERARGEGSSDSPRIFSPSLSFFPFTPSFCISGSLLPPRVELEAVAALNILCLRPVYTNDFCSHLDCDFAGIFMAKLTPI